MYVIEDTSNEAPEQDELAQDDLARELRTVVALRTKGRCRDGHGTLTHLFFSEDLYDIARAKAICAKCQVSALCLSTALDRQENKTNRRAVIGLIKLSFHDRVSAGIARCHGPQTTEHMVRAKSFWMELQRIALASRGTGCCCTTKRGCALHFVCILRDWIRRIRCGRMCKLMRQALAGT